jgi:outer membrane protein assembly factor BamB/orotate phosphoribosyltransferase
MASASGAAEEWEVLRRAIYERALLLSDQITYDFRQVLTQARYARLAGRLLWRLVKGHRPEVLVGPGFGAAPLMSAVAMAALDDGIDLASLMVRERRKRHGRKRWVEGARCPAKARAVIIDDFLGRGSAIALTEEALRSDGVEVEICALGVLFDDWRPMGSRQIAVGRFPVVSVFKRHDIGLTRDCHDARPPDMRGTAPPFIESPLWWRFELNVNGAFSIKCAPVIADDAVYAADDSSRVWCLDALTGEARWRYESLVRPAKGIVQRLLHVDGSVVFGCYDGTVTRLDAESGDVRWRWRVGSHVHATPVVDVAGRRLFINTEQENGGDPCGHLQALDWESGRVLWRHRHGFWPPGSPVYSEAHRAVVATCNDRSIVCVDADSGDLRWRGETAGLVRGKPALSGEQVVVATESGFLQSFDLACGAVLHARRHGPGLHHQFLHVADGVAYALDGASHLTAFDLLDLRVLWLSRLRSSGAWTPVPFRGYLVVLSHEGHVAVLDSTLRLKVWEGRVGGTYGQPPAIGHARGVPLLVTAANDSGLRAFRIHPLYDRTPS